MGGLGTRGTSHNIRIRIQRRLLEYCLRIGPASSKGAGRSARNKESTRVPTRCHDKEPHHSATNKRLKGSLFLNKRQDSKSQTAAPATLALAKTSSVLSNVMMGLQKAKASRNLEPLVAGAADLTRRSK